MTTYDLAPSDVRGIPWPYNVVDECLEEIVNEYETEYWRKYLEMTWDQLIEELDDILHESDESFGSIPSTPFMQSLLPSEDEMEIQHDHSSITRTDAASSTYLKIYSSSVEGESDCSSLLSESLIHLLARLEDIEDISEDDSEYLSLRSLEVDDQWASEKAVQRYTSQGRPGSFLLLDF